MSAIHGISAIWDAHYWGFHCSSSSCIYLIFTSQPNLISDSGVHSLLYPNCHQKIVFAKLNLNIVHPPPYLRKIRHCREANTGLIRLAIKQFNWERAFSNTTVNEKLDIFNRTVLNILRNKILHEIIVCDNKDPPWFNNRIKILSQEKNGTYKVYYRNKDNTDLRSFCVSILVFINSFFVVSSFCRKSMFCSKL